MGHHLVCIHPFPITSVPERGHGVLEAIPADIWQKLGKTF